MEKSQLKKPRTKQEVVRTGISLPKDLLERFDSVLEKTNYDSRSRAIRDAIEHFISRFMDLPEGKEEKVRALVVSYKHQKGGAEALARIQNLFVDIVISSTHVPLEPKKGLKIVIGKGKTETIKKLSAKMMGEEGVEEVKSVLVTLPGETDAVSKVSHPSRGRLNPRE